MLAVTPDFSDLVDRMRLSAERIFLPALTDALGAGSMPDLRRLLSAIHQVFDHAPCELFTGGLTIVRGVAQPQQAFGDCDGQKIQPPGVSGLHSDRLTLEVLDDGLRVIAEAPSLADASTAVIGYEFVYEASERMVAGGVSVDMPRGVWPCWFAIPTYSRLEEALANYTLRLENPDSCPDVRSSWREDSRLAFSPKPEHRLRSSLMRALRYSMSDATVRPELNQDESKPVDLEVSWWGADNVSIIEIKWLGKSGLVGAAHFSKKFYDGRAIEGLMQLANYLDLRHRTTPETTVMGTLVVFDARRRNLKPTESSISQADGFYYQFRDIEYPADVLARPDIAQPVRTFLRPVCAT